MGDSRFGLYSGEVSEYLFGLHTGHLTTAVDQIAGRHGAWHVNYTEPCGERHGWSACPNRGPSFNRVIARAVMADIDQAGGIESLYRGETEPGADEFCASSPNLQPLSASPGVSGTTRQPRGAGTTDHKR